MTSSTSSSTATATAGLRTLPDALAEAARSDAGYVFIAPGGDIRRSYADIRLVSLGIARSLLEAGLRRGDLVALVLPDAESFLTALFGASMAGVVPASLYPPAPAADPTRYLELTAKTLRASRARALVTTQGLAAAFEPRRADCPELAQILAYETLDAPARELDVPLSLDDIAVVQFTSGSTSMPKGVAISHRNLSANVDAINGPAGLMTTGRDVAVSWLPLNHDMGLVGMALGPLYAARPGVFLPAASFVKRPAEWLRAMTRFRGTVSFAPNFAYDLCVRRVTDRDLDGLDLSSWRVAGCGAEPIRAATLAAFAGKFASAGFRADAFLPSYGLAEHVLAATFPPRGRGVVTERTAVGCGRALPGHQVRISDQGEILLAGPSVMVGYHNDAASTAQTIRDGWLHTGDLGFLSDGELFVCGRLKDIIIVNGRKYHPQDLEWAVDDLAGVRRGRVVAFGVVEAGRADRVVLVVEPSGVVAGDALVDAVRHRIGDVFGLYVDEIALVPGGTVGRTTSGKMQRAATRARYERGELAWTSSTSSAE